MFQSPSALDAQENESRAIFRKTFSNPSVSLRKVTELKLSEQATRLINGDTQGSMKKKKTEGSF